MTIQLDWKAWNAKRKAMGGRISGAAKRVTGSKAYKIADKPFAIRRKVAGATFKAGIGVIGKATSLRRKVAKHYAKTAVGAAKLPFKAARAYGRATAANYGRVKKAFGKVKRFEGVEPTIALQEAPGELYDTLAAFLTEGDPAEKVYFDKTEFDLEGVGLPETEDGFYEIDADTAAEVLDALDEIVAEDEEEFPEDEEDEIPEDEEELEGYDGGQLELQNRVIALEQQLALKEVDAAIAEARAYRDERGFGHAAITLEIFEALMKGEPLSDTIALEDGSDPAAVGAYLREGLLFALQTIPGQQPMEGKTVGGEVKKLEASGDGNKFEDGKKIAKTFWSQL